MNDTNEVMLEKLLRRNPAIFSILNRAPTLKLPNWYLGAGCIAQTVWNDLHGFAPNAHIKDYDLVYFDSDLSYQAEDECIKRGQEHFRDLHLNIEIRNEARVHLWYQQHFGKPLEYVDASGKPSFSYGSMEDAISTWPTTATSIGVKLDEKGAFVAFAPFGLNDLFGMVVRPTKRGVPKEVYLEKVQDWTRFWPKLRVIPWD